MLITIGLICNIPGHCERFLRIFQIFLLIWGLKKIHILLWVDSGWWIDTWPFTSREGWVWRSLPGQGQRHWGQRYRGPCSSQEPSDQGWAAATGLPKRVWDVWQTEPWQCGASSGPVPGSRASLHGPGICGSGKKTAKSLLFCRGFLVGQGSFKWCMRCLIPAFL